MDCLSIFAFVLAFAWPILELIGTVRLVYVGAAIRKIEKATRATPFQARAGQLVVTTMVALHGGACLLSYLAMKENSWLYTSEGVLDVSPVDPIVSVKLVPGLPIIGVLVLKAPRRGCTHRLIGKPPKICRPPPPTASLCKEHPLSTAQFLLPAEKKRLAMVDVR